MTKHKKAPLLESEVRFKIIYSDMRRYYIVEEKNETIICYCGNKYMAEQIVESLNGINYLDEEDETIN